MRNRHRIDHRHGKTQRFDLTLIRRFHTQKGIHGEFHHRKQQHNGSAQRQGPLPGQTQRHTQNHRRGKQNAVVTDHRSDHRHHRKADQVQRAVQPFSFGRDDLQAISGQQQGANRKAGVLPGVHGGQHHQRIEQDQCHGDDRRQKAEMLSDHLTGIADDTAEAQALKQHHGADPAAGQRQRQLKGQQGMQHRMPVVVLVIQGLGILVEAVCGITAGEAGDQENRKNCQRRKIENAIHQHLPTAAFFFFQPGAGMHTLQQPQRNRT